MGAVAGARLRYAWGECDPQFTNAAKNNFTLRPTSPAIDTGTALPGITTDYTGTPRPQGKGYDIGAYASYRSPAQRIAPTLACQH